MFLIEIVKRIPEPELMNSFEQVKAYAEADFSENDEKVISRVAEEVNRSALVLKNKRIIDIGCGPGNISERLAVQWPEAEVIGIDGSKEMISFAERRKKNLNKKKDLVNLSYINLEINQFENHFKRLEDKASLIVSNSVLHHIHNPKAFWNSIKAIGKSGSLTFHCDLHRPETKRDAIKDQRKYLPDSPTILIHDYLASLYAAFTVQEVQSQLYQVGLSNLNVYKVDERYLEIIGIL